MTRSRRRFLGDLTLSAGALCWPACVEAPPEPRAPKFHWGVAVENTWMAQSDPAYDGDRRLLDEYALTEHDERFEDDLALARDLGVTSVRTSVPWYLSEPSPEQYDFDWFDRVIDHCLKLDLVPIVDLIHYGTPAWMETGIGDARFEASLAAYARKLGGHFRGRVSHFTPHNEPQLAALYGGALGLFPPYGQTAQRWAELGVRIARAMVLATETLRDEVPKARIFSAELIHWPAAEALFGTLPEEPEARDALVLSTGSFPASLAYGRIVATHPLVDRLASLGVPSSQLEWFTGRAAPPDVLGYNHYPDLVDFAADGDFTRGGSLPLHEAARQAADKVEQALRRVARYFGQPVWLSETSAGLAGEARAAYAHALGEMTDRLLADGVPLVGLHWWPLLTAAQWRYRDEPSTPLDAFLVPGGWNNGLFDLVRDGGGGLERVATAAAEAFATMVRERTRA